MHSCTLLLLIVSSILNSLQYLIESHYVVYFYLYKIIVSIIPFFSFSGNITRVAVQSRNGPDVYETTSWLLFSRIAKEDEGTYVCKAENDAGTNAANATVSVTSQHYYKQNKINHTYSRFQINITVLYELLMQQ